MAQELTPRRVRPAIRRIAIWVTPVLLFIGAWQIWDAIEARRVEETLAGLSTRATADAQSARVEDDAARYYAAATTLAVSGDRDVLQVSPGGPLLDPESALRDTLASGNRPSDAAIAVARRQIERGRAVIDLLAHASGFEFGRFLPGTEFNYRTLGHMSVDRLAGLETLNLALNDDGSGAAKVLVDRVKLLRAWKGENRMLSAFSARVIGNIATDLGIVVARTHPSEERLADLDRALSAVHADQDLAQSIRQEVVHYYDWTRRHSTLMLLVRPLINHNVVTVAHTGVLGAQAAALPWPARLRAIAELRDEGRFMPLLGEYPFAGFIKSETVALAEAVASTRCARMVIAAERYRRARGGLPQTLDGVIAGDDERALDPFTGRSLLYSRDATSFTIYSVGRDGKDDGGKLSADLPRGRVPGTLPPPDVGVRVQTLATVSSRLAQP